MKLKKISARNFKGLTFSLDLTDMNLLVGGNFAGKSARTDAIRLCLIGYLPELGKLARATFGLSSGKEMEVTGEFDDGTVIRRNWYLRGDSVSATSLLPPWYKDDSPMLTVMLNAETYFALSERERVNYVAANVPQTSAYTADSIWKELESKMNQDALPGGTDWIPNIVFEWRGLDPSLPVHEFIEKALEICKAGESSARAHALRMEKSIQGLAALRTMDAQTQNLTFLDSKKATLETELLELYGAKAKHASLFEAARSNRNRRKELTEGLRAKVRCTDLRDSLVNQIDAREHELSQIEAVDPDAMQKMREADKDAALALADLRNQLADVEASLTRNEAELAGIAAKTECPYCGAKGEGWKAIKTGEINSTLAGLTVKREQLIGHRVLVRVHADGLVRRLSQMTEAVNQRAAIDTKLSSWRAALADAERMLATMDAQEQELSRLPAEDAQVQATGETLQSSINVKSEELRAVETARTAAIARDSELRRLAQFETERDAAKIDQQVAATAAETLRGIQRKMVEDAFVPLLETANGIFGAVLRSPLAYNAENAEIGTWRDGVWVGHKTFSGTEKALCYSAIQAALAARSPVKMMIIDELGRLDDSNAENVIGCIASAIENKVIDTFVGIDTGRSELYRELNDSALLHRECELTVTEIS